MGIVKNVGRCDAIFRIIIGLLILSTTTLVYLGPKSCWGYLGLIGLVPMITGLIGFCPPYKLFGINTCCKEEDKGSKSCAE